MDDDIVMDLKGILYKMNSHQLAKEKFVKSNVIANLTY